MEIEAQAIQAAAVRLEDNLLTAVELNLRPSGQGAGALGWANPAT